MTQLNLNALTGQSDTATSTRRSEASETPFTRSHNSKLSHIMNSIRHALAHEQEKLPSNNGGEKHMSQQQATVSGPISPALQAVASSNLNENNMGETFHQNDQTWGWPGFGTLSSYSSTTSQRSKPRTESTGSGGHTEAKVEAATFEAINNAAEFEMYGWPGVGDWTTSPRK